MRIRRCFLDLDGVLVDFLRGALEACGAADMDYPKGQYWIEEVLGVTRADMWSRFGDLERFFADLKWHRDGPEIWRLAQVYYGGDGGLWLLSTPHDGGEGTFGKMQWVERNLGAAWTRRLILAWDKTACAAPSSLLVDDCPGNVDSWRACGGRAVLVPRIYNPAEGDAVDAVRAAFAEHLAKEMMA